MKTIVAAAIAVMTLIGMNTPAFAQDRGTYVLSYGPRVSAWDGKLKFSPDRDNRICLTVKLDDPTAKLRVEVIADNQPGPGKASDSRTWGPGALGRNQRDCPYKTMKTPGNYHLRYYVVAPGNMQRNHTFEIRIEADPAR